ncbi:hypothetical protein [Morganella morganii]|uniref:hypothetical protein n=1 Tax=Morganella morganii TaxID=582 RepID=UPI00228F770B|nr:hypothetical protein [Morganella morganii]
MRTYRKAKPTTATGTVTNSPKRVKTATGKVMETLNIQAESEHRSPYPLKLVAFDTDALELMTCRKGNRITATGRPQWYNGYLLSGVTIEAPSADTQNS